MESIGYFVMNTNWLALVIFVLSAMWPILLLGIPLFKNDSFFKEIMFPFFLFGNFLVLGLCLLLIQPYIVQLNGPILPGESNRAMVWFFMTCVASVTPIYIFICLFKEIFKGFMHLAKRISGNSACMLA